MTKSIAKTTKGIRKLRNFFPPEVSICIQSSNKANKDGKKNKLAKKISTEISKKACLPSAILCDCIIWRITSRIQVLASITILSLYSSGKSILRANQKNKTKRLPSLSWFFLIIKLIVEVLTKSSKHISRVSAMENAVIGSSSSRYL